MMIARLLFYGVLGAIAVALLAMRYGDSPAEPLVGTTSQDTAFSMELDREGRAVRFDTQLIAYCPNGATWPVRWWEADSPRVPFERDGGRLRVEARVGPFTFGRGDVARQRFSLDARVTDDRADGLITFTETIEAVTGADYACSSGPVRFTAQR